MNTETTSSATPTLMDPVQRKRPSLYRLPSARTATQPPQPPGAGPEVRPTGNDTTQLDQSLPGV